MPKSTFLEYKLSLFERGYKKWQILKLHIIVARIIVAVGSCNNFLEIL
ncbi:hypothetical protein [Helicobacter cinaedi]|nr:hypothetical protein [Helicobacter cinaedi]